MTHFTAILLFATLACALQTDLRGMSLDLSRRGIQDWLCENRDTCIQNLDLTSPPALLKSLTKRLKSHLQSQLASPTGFFKTLHSIGRKIPRADMSHPFFSFIPMPLGSVVPGSSLSTSTKCFDQVTVTAAWNGTNDIVVKFDMVGQKSVLCTDLLIAVSGSGAHIQIADMGTTYTGVIHIAKVSAAEKWFLDSQGVMIFIEPLSLLDAIDSIIDTVTLMQGYFENPISAATINASIMFLRDYVQISPRMQPQMVPRSAGSAVIEGIDPSLINSGDILLVMRPDGLDPMIGWGEGSTVGHSTIAIRTPDKSLLVCESTTVDAYWPVNGVQCTPWTEWVGRVVAANMDVDLVPLSKEASSQFNTSAALEFFNSVKGLDYGFSTFIFGWIDKKTANFPCVPPNYDICLTPESAFLVAILVDELSGSQHQNIFRQGVSHRVGLWPQDATVMESLQHAVTKLGMKSFSDIYVKPEQDSWLYNNTRDGNVTIAKSMVCCVFVCNMWKAGGLFSSVGNDIQCGEQTLWDIYSMKLFDAGKMGSGRPQICQKYDPNNNLCQLTGNTTLHILPDLNTRALYRRMGENCSSLCPDYVREPGC